MDWKDITLNQFNELQEVLKIEDETERMIGISEVVFGDSITELPLSEYTKKLKELDFLKTELPNTHIVKSVTVNGRSYKVDGLLGNITAAQYLDYTNHLKSNDMAKLLSVFLIPAGHKYNDGYDMIQVINDMGSLPIDIVNSTAFFFIKQYNRFIKIFLSSLAKKIKKMKVKKNEKKIMMDLLQPLESYLIL